MHIPSANGLVIDLVNTLAIPTEDAAHRQFGIRGPGATQTPASVLEQQLNTGTRRRPAPV